MQRNQMNQDNDRIGSNGYGQMNRGYDNDQHRGYDNDQHRDHSRESTRSYDDNRYASNRRDEAGYGGSQYSGYRGTDDRTQRSSGYDDRGFLGGYERHPHDEHERGRWGQDYSDRSGHRYMGGQNEDDRYRRPEGFERSGYQSHGFYDRTHSGVYGQRGDRSGGYDQRGDRSGGYDQRGGDRYDERYRMNRDEYDRGSHYQDRDDRGRFNDTGEGRSYGRGYTGGYDQSYDRRFEQGDRGRFGGSDTRAHYDPSHDSYGRGGYGRDDRRFDEQRGQGGSVASNRFGHSDNDSDNDRRWSSGGYEEDRRGRGRGRY